MTASQSVGFLSSFFSLIVFSKISMGEKESDNKKTGQHSRAVDMKHTFKGAGGLTCDSFIL